MNHEGELADLAAEFPHWSFAAMWQSASDGPDPKNLRATRDADGVLLSAPNAALLREKIRHEDQT